MAELEKKINYMYKTCMKKKVYRTLEYAKQKAEEYTKRFGNKHYVYMCPLCLNYHLTTHKHEGAKYYN